MNLKYINLNKINLIKTLYNYNLLLIFKFIKINTIFYIKNSIYFYFNYYNILQYKYYSKKISIKFKFEKFLLSIFIINLQLLTNIYIQDYNYFKYLIILKYNKTYLTNINNILIKKNLHKQLYTNYLILTNINNNFKVTPLIKELYIQLYNIYNIQVYFKYNILKYTTLQIKLFNIKKNLITIEKIFEGINTTQYYIISNNISILFKYIINKNYLNLTILNFYYINLISTDIKKTLNIFKNNLILPYIENSKLSYGGNVFTYNNFIPKAIIYNIYNNIKLLTNTYESSKFTLHFGYNLILESLINEYKFQGIILPIKFFEIISRKMNLCVKIHFIGDTYFTIEDIIPLTFINIINYNYYKYGYIQATYYPIILGITKLTLGINGILSTLSFQETLKTLSKVILDLQFDWLLDFKSKIISSELLESGTGWFRHFIYK